MPNAWERKEKMVRYLADRIRRRRSKKKSKTVYELARQDNTVDKLLKRHDEPELMEDY